MSIGKPGEIAWERYTPTRYSGCRDFVVHCALCRREIAKGDMACWGPRRKEAVHATCRQKPSFFARKIEGLEVVTADLQVLEAADNAAFLNVPTRWGKV